MQTGKKQVLNRRSVLGSLGGALAAAPTAILSPTDAQAYDPGRDQTKARYRETDHVKAFYRTNGYETLAK